MLVSYTQTPMVLDAVGALKVTHYYGRSALDDVYTYLRAFVLRGDLIFSLTAFEQTPPAESRIAVAFRFLPEKDPFFYLTVGPACPVEAFLSGSNGMVSLSLPCLLYTSLPRFSLPPYFDPTLHMREMY